MPLVLRLWLAPAGCAFALLLGAHQARAQDQPAPAPVGAVAVIHTAAGDSHACAVVQGGVTPGGVFCWGANESGQIGSPARDPSPWPVQVPLLRDAVQVAAGLNFSCALLADGQVLCWGANDAGQLGRGSMANPVPNPYLPAQVMDLEPAVAIEAGARFACAIMVGGAVRCWGRNDSGQLGSGEIGSPQPRPVPVVGLSGAVQISAGLAHTCARLADGAIRCWGRNDVGQLGNGTESALEPLPQQVRAITAADDLDVNFEYTCAVQTGRLFCWGAPPWPADAATGVLSAVPLQVPGIADAQDVAAGYLHMCVRRLGGTVECFGANSLGELGRGTAGERQGVAAVVGLRDAVQLVAGGLFTCAVRTTGTLECWGFNSRGALGGGRETPARQPEIVPGLEGVVEVAGGNAITCARTSGGAVYCWGDSSRGGAGRGARAGSHVPGPVIGITQAIDIAVGESDACAVLATGEVACWSGATTLTPTMFGMPAPAAAVTLGSQHACALLIDGTVACWGDNNQGQVGTGTVGGYVQDPQRVAGLSDVTVLDAQANTTCAARAGGDVLCWGLLFERLIPQIPGPWPPQYVPTPTRRFTLEGITSLGVQLVHVSALAGGRVSRWLVTIPGVLHGGLEPLFGTQDIATHLAADLAHACAVTDNGEAWCWGYNYNYQVGPQTETDLSRPQPVYGLGQVADVGTGNLHSCAVLASGRVACWGSNARGEAGINPGWLPAPVVGLGGSTVLGRVRDSFGIPIPYARLVSGERWTLPDTQGYFAMGGLAEGSPPVQAVEESFNFTLEAAGQFPPPPEVRWFVGTPVTPSTQQLPLVQDN